MKVLRLEIENILNLRAISITPNGRVTTITGKNGAGKSSIINAMFYALAGTKGHAKQPIRRGQQRATVRLSLGDSNVEYTVTLRITEGGSALDITAPNGFSAPKPQTLLNAILGQLTFDPSAFARLAPADRLDTLRKLVTLDVDVDALDQANARDFALRTDWNRRVKSFADRVQVAAQDVHPEMQVELIDISALVDELARASEHNSAIEAARQARDVMRMKAINLYTQATEADEKASELRRLSETFEIKATRLRESALELERQLETAVPLGVLIDGSAVRRDIASAQDANAAVDRQLQARHQHQRAAEEHQSARAEADRLTAAMAARDEQKRAAIAAAEMPIDGLGFGDGDLTFNGLPFAQASTGEQLRIATAIGMALNPQLRVLCVRDGSLLDEESLTILEQMAEQHDFQVWLEMTTNAPTVGIHIVDGEIAAIDGEAIEPDAEAEVA